MGKKYMKEENRMKTKHYITGMVVVASEITEQNFMAEYANGGEPIHSQQDQIGYAVKCSDSYMRYYPKALFEKIFRQVDQGEFVLLNSFCEGVMEG